MKQITYQIPYEGSSFGGVKTPAVPERASDREAELRRLLVEANEIIRSISAICDRSGERTNWEGLKIQVARVLSEQHRMLHPEQYDSGPRAG